MLRTQQINVQYIFKTNSAMYKGWKNSNTDSQAIEKLYGSKATLNVVRYLLIVIAEVIENSQNKIW